MKKVLLITTYLAAVALIPVVLAASEGVPTRSTYQTVVLLLSLGAFGVVLGQFGLTRLAPRAIYRELKLARMLRWHRVVGYVAGGFLLVHPLLMIARRLWVEESDPVGNLLLLLGSSALLPALVAWGLLVALVVLSVARRWFAARRWRVLHGALSAAFAAVATWHVVAVGRHSDALLSAVWIAMAAGALGGLLRVYLPVRSRPSQESQEGVTHGRAA